MKKINVIIFYLLELISMLSILLLSFFGKMDGDLGLILADEIVYLPVILYVLFTIFLILEGIKNRKVPLSRIITIVIGVLSSIIMYSDSNRISMLNATLFIFSIVLSIMVIVRMLKKIPNSNIEGNLEKTLPEGIFSNKQLILQSISIMIIVILASIVIFLVFIIIVGMVTIVISAIVKPDDIEMMSMIMDIKNLYVGMALIGYIFMAIGFLISVFVKSSKKATPIALGVFFASYVFFVEINKEVA